MPDPTQSTHTPGPWKAIEPVAIDYRAPLIYGADGASLVAVAEGGGPKHAIAASEARANARLIAAAPDLLAAVKAQHDTIDRLFARLITIDPTFRPTKSTEWPTVIQGNAAVVKAEGRNA